MLFQTNIIVLQIGDVVIPKVSLGSLQWSVPGHMQQQQVSFTFGLHLDNPKYYITLGAVFFLIFFLALFFFRGHSFLTFSLFSITLPWFFIGFPSFFLTFSSFCSFFPLVFHNFPHCFLVFHYFSLVFHHVHHFFLVFHYFSLVFHWFSFTSSLVFLQFSSLFPRFPVFLFGFA